MLSCEGGAVVEFRAEKAGNFRCRKMPNRWSILQQDPYSRSSGARARRFGKIERRGIGLVTFPQNVSQYWWNDYPERNL
jgi:hypothetical protein